MDRQCIQEEMEYREWREAPHWYCVKTVMDNLTGKLTSEIVADEKTHIAIIIQQVEKPQDGVFETAASTTYYTYHRGYEEAKRQMMAARA